MPIDKTKKMTFDEWLEVVKEEANKPAQPYQAKLQDKIEKKTAPKK